MSMHVMIDAKAMIRKKACVVHRKQNRYNYMELKQLH